VKLLHLTDTHLVKPGETLYGLDPLRRLHACLADMNAQHADADLAVITGDLTHWGEPEAYAALRDCLRSLKIPVRLLLGNHDVREVFVRYFPQEPRDAQGFVQSVLDMAGYRLLFLDTNEPGTHAGWYCDQRRTWLVERLVESGETPVFVFMHHPPFPVYLRALDAIGLTQAEEFAAAVAPYRSRIRHLFFGHVHRPISGSWGGVPFTTLRATNHQCWLDFSATNTIPGSHEPPAYAIAFIDADNVVIHFHDYLDASPKYPLGTTRFADWAKERTGMTV
jgi:Icc protein